MSTPFDLHITLGVHTLPQVDNPHSMLAPMLYGFPVIHDFRVNSHPLKSTR